MIGPDGLHERAEPALEGLTQKEAERAHPRLVPRARPARRARAYRHAVALCERCETRIEPRISLQWWCSMEELQEAGARGAARARAVRFHPESPAPLRDRLARGRARLVHLAPDLVGPSAADLVVPGRSPHRRGDRARRVRGVRLDEADARDGRARHVVLARRSGRSRRSAGPTRPRTCAASTRATCRRRRARSSASGRTG